ncbi:MAG: helix-turn-helix transcriptional regulator [Lachnospiraceae bacterium]|nr:helix-turn-helix transcriptional regulator [Lachnospiraceae bacterium]
MKKGIAVTSMDDIAKAAGYSKATLYVYFENKEEIVGILVLNKINVDFESRNCLPEEKETYQVVEEINEIIKEFLITGMEKGELRSDLKIMPTIFNFWGMIAGIIQLSANKEEYIKDVMGLSKKQFLEYGLQILTF